MFNKKAGNKRIGLAPRISFVFMIFAYSCFAQQKKPNIILILADDMGYSDIGCYGGEVNTPNINYLASTGIRYKRFYNAARCCPTRASLLTGLYPHQAGMGWMVVNDGGDPGYRGNLSNHCVTIAEVLKKADYSTYMVGKWHVTGDRKIDGKVTDNWPLQRGFDRYFGIIPGKDSYFTPTLCSGNKVYKAPPNFYLTNAISDTAVRYIGEHAVSGTKPFFMYIAYTSPHWPLHALQKDIDKYKKTYTCGWDELRKARFERQKKMGLIPASAVLSPRDPVIPAWNTLNKEEKADMSMRMSVYAAQIDIMDQGIGRIVNQLKVHHLLGNTLIFFLSDNGGCAEYVSEGKSKVPDGSAESYESYRINWANASNTPFRQYKHYTLEGGIATPLIIHWPEGINKKLNSTYIDNYGHISDIMATCSEVAAAAYPKTFRGFDIKPLEGKSLLAHLSHRSNQRGEIFWEHEGNIAVRDGDWKLVAETPPDEEFSTKRLELYNLRIDPTEMKNLAKSNPARVKSMYADWQKWAGRSDVFPLDTRTHEERVAGYTRHINGEFDDNFGGWKLNAAEEAGISFVIDTTGKLSGKKSALITAIKNQEPEKKASMSWTFKAKKSETVNVSLSSVASGNFHYLFTLSKPGGQALFSQRLQGSNTTSRLETAPFVVTTDGSYKLTLEFDSLKAGDRLWLDNINLNFVQP